MSPTASSHSTRVLWGSNGELQGWDPCGIRNKGWDPCGIRNRNQGWDLFGIQKPGLGSLWDSETRAGILVGAEFKGWGLGVNWDPERIRAAVDPSLIRSPSE